MFSVKPWASRLHGIVAARGLRAVLVARLDPEYPLKINLAGIKEITPGFARECFGMLYLEAARRGCQITFTSTPNHLKPVLLSSISAALKPKYAKQNF